MSITKYKNLGNSSNVDWFEIGEEFLRVKFFNTSKIYQYSYSGKAGKIHVDELKRLAVNGKGLNSYIMMKLKEKYD